ncbi:MAG: RNA methyltransferase [Gemmatimonadales bacterium]
MPLNAVVVLVEPQELVNVAHVVRAMKNFGLRDLRLVAPAEYDAYRVEGIAHQTRDILGRVREFETLDEATADCTHVVGFTARGRRAKRITQRPRDAAVEIVALAADEDQLVALVFGREDKGLTNEQLDRCHRMVTIPSTDDYPSLNLSHAVVVMAYELALASGAEARAVKSPRRVADPAAAAELERLFLDAERALRTIDFFKTRNVEHVMRTVRDLAHRVPLDQREAKLLRAISIEVVKYGDRLAHSRIHLDRK